MIKNLPSTAPRDGSVIIAEFKGLEQPLPAVWISTEQVWRAAVLTVPKLIFSGYEQFNQDDLIAWWPIGSMSEQTDEENRMDVIGQNGNDGLHYDEV